MTPAASTMSVSLQLELTRGLEASQFNLDRRQHCPNPALLCRDRAAYTDPDGSHVIDFQIMLLLQVDLQLLNAFMCLQSVVV